jgi:hypothetical protein
VALLAASCSSGTGVLEITNPYPGRRDSQPYVTLEKVGVVEIATPVENR